MTQSNTEWVEVDYADAIGQVNKSIRELGTQAALARKVGITPQNLSNQLNNSGNRNVSDEVFHACGVQVRVVKKYLVRRARAETVND